MPLEQDESEIDMNFNWTDITVFENPLLTENVEPEMTDLTARAPKPLSQPNEPSEQQRQVHNMTHLPFRSWCPHCVHGKAKEQQSVKSTDRQPVIQVDYCFVTTGKDSHGSECPQITVLTATDVQTGLGMSAVVPQKGRQKYCVAELKRFVFKIRTLRLQLQERYGLEITAQDCIYPWIVEHGQFL